MSTTSVLGVNPDQRPIVLGTFRNAWGWGPRIWDPLLQQRGSSLTRELMKFGREETELDLLWADIENLPEYQQVALVLTFDLGVITWGSLEWAAEMLREFDSNMPAPPRAANHVPAVADLFNEIHRNPEAPQIGFVGVYGTSVSDCPFDPWDEENDRPGSGVPLSSLYLLPRDRS